MNTFDGKFGQDKLWKKIADFLLKAALEPYHRTADDYFENLSIEAQDNLLALESPPWSAVNVFDAGVTGKVVGDVLDMDDDWYWGSSVSTD